MSQYNFEGTQGTYDQFMNERVVRKMTNFCVAYMYVAGGVPMRGVSRSGSFVKLSNSPTITRAPRLELTVRRFGNLNLNPIHP